MNWILRYYEDIFSDLIKKGKVFVLYGPRQVGKTSLIKKVLKNHDGKIFEGTGEDLLLKTTLEKREIQNYRLLFSDYDIIYIDEAQYVNQVGLVLKIMVDAMPDKVFIVTGSSSFNISHEISEPLTGRHIVRVLYPISLIELKRQFGSWEVFNRVEEFLVFGMYPEVFSLKSIKDKIEYLITVRNSYLFKDILSLENIKNSSKLVDLLRLLAFQLGNEVSVNELSNNLGIAKGTVERYLDLLEKAFVIKKLGSFSKNLRNEIQKSAKYYFYDNGIRNAVINNFSLVNERNDTGSLWENFIIMEFLKKQEYERIFSNNFFWRTYDKKEIDFVEERDGKLLGYEIKWKKEKIKTPSLWKRNYPNASYSLVNRENFLEFF